LLSIFIRPCNSGAIAERAWFS